MHSCYSKDRRAPWFPFGMKNLKQPPLHLRLSMNTVPFFSSPPSPPDLTHLTATDLEPTTLPTVAARPTDNSNTSRLEPPSNPRTPSPPPVTTKMKKGYAPAKSSPKNLIHTIRAVTHNTEKKPPTPLLLQHFKQGFDIVFLQELRKKSLLPHIYNQKGHRAVIFSNLSPHNEHGSGLAFSPMEMNDLELVFLETYPSFPSNNPKMYPKGDHTRRRQHTQHSTKSRE